MWPLLIPLLLAALDEAARPAEAEPVLYDVELVEVMHEDGNIYVQGWDFWRGKNLAQSESILRFHQLVVLGPDGELTAPDWGKEYQSPHLWWGDWGAEFETSMSAWTPREGACFIRVRLKAKHFYESWSSMQADQWRMYYPGGW